MLAALFVDDDPALLDVIARILRREPYKTFTTTSIDQAFEILRTTQVDVIVSDGSMPGTSGDEFLERVGKEYPKIVRMMLSGEANGAISTRKARGGKPYRFLSKPIDLLDLRRAMREAFQASELSLRAP